MNRPKNAALFVLFLAAAMSATAAAAIGLELWARDLARAAGAS